jgi:4-hydroxy-tetrahydrodipicolinate synthase
VQRQVNPKPTAGPTLNDVGTSISGVWLPIVTPFWEGAVDLESYERLLNHYLEQGVNGVIPLGTTGESATIEADEADAIVEATVRIATGRARIYIGLGGNSTAKVVKALKRLERHVFEGILSVCPYYNRPSEAGILEHFARIAASTDRKLLIYNIPYRTGVNLSNDAVLSLSETPNIVGIKDSCAILTQSLDLLRRRRTTFSVMTGEDALFYTMLANGADGGILASAHFRPELFVRTYDHMRNNDYQSARIVWSTLEPVIPLLFREPNPAPIKHWLWRRGLIRSPECRLPLSNVSASLANEIDSLDLGAGHGLLRSW